MSEIVWEDPTPPSSGGPHGVWVKRLSPLLERPNEWARVHETPTRATAASTAQGLKHGRYRMPVGRFEFTIRANHIYVRYLGPENGQ